jgi:hypothetical protein
VSMSKAKTLRLSRSARCGRRNGTKRTGLLTGWG